jgi:predicted nucleotidyltransferase
MRLSQQDTQSICDTAASSFAGITYSLWFFGSRTDATKRGGDIDLLIEVDTDTDLAEIHRRETDFLVDLKGKIGEQKVDDVVATPAKLNDNPFFSIIVSSRILLCESIVS